MLTGDIGTGTTQGREFRVALARTPAEVGEAQRLRHAVFAGEQGARLADEGVDRDRFDPFCDHLVVRHCGSGEVVGTYRILSPGGARGAGGYYSEQEFDLGRFTHLRPSLVEIGRSCIHPGFRTGAVIQLLWGGLARYMMRHRHEYLMGCASISLADGGATASALYREVEQGHLAPVEYRAFPRHPLPLREAKEGFRAAWPPLIKGYLRCGAWVCSPPAWDPEFNTADLLLMIAMSRVNTRYARHFMGGMPGTRRVRSTERSNDRSGERVKDLTAA